MKQSNSIMAALMITKGMVITARTTGMTMAIKRSLLSRLMDADMAGIEPRSRSDWGRLMDRSMPTAWTCTLDPGIWTWREGWGKETPCIVLGTSLMMVKPRARPIHNVMKR